MVFFRKGRRGTTNGYKWSFHAFFGLMNCCFRMFSCSRLLTHECHLVADGRQIAIQIMHLKAKSASLIPSLYCSVGLAIVRGLGTVESKSRKKWLATSCVCLSGELLQHAVTVTLLSLEVFLGMVFSLDNCGTNLERLLTSKLQTNNRTRVKDGASWIHGVCLL